MKKTIIYILHGWAYSTEKWEPFIAAMNNQGIDTKLLKIPGLTAPLDKVWGIDEYVEWLRRALEKENGKVILLGHSNGGRISLAFAALYPEKVDRLILIDSAGIYHDELPIKIKRLVFGVIAKVGKHIPKTKQFRYLLYKFAREHDYENANKIVRKTMINLLHYDVRNILSHVVSIPTIIIWGEQDKITPLSDAKLLHKGLKRSSLHIISNARHSPQFTHVAEVTKQVLNALK